MTPSPLDGPFPTGRQLTDYSDDPGFAIPPRAAALTRAEAAYAHLASFAKGDQVVVSGRNYALEGEVTKPQQDARDMRRAWLIVTGAGTFDDGHGGWERRPVECVITVDKMLSGRCLTLATTEDAAAGNWAWFDSATWDMRNQEG